MICTPLHPPAPSPHTFHIKELDKFSWPGLQPLSDDLEMEGGTGSV